MNYTYFLAVIGNRAIALLCVVILAYLLPASDFGVYALSATNALLLEIVLSSWIATSASKYLATATPEQRPGLVGALLASMIGIAALMAVLLSAYLVAPFAPFGATDLALVAGWAAALMIYDVTLAAKNALDRPGAYAALAIARNLGALILSVGLVAAGYGLRGAIVGQIVGTIAPVFLLPHSAGIWLTARVRGLRWQRIGEMFRFGISGTLALGLYMLFNAGGRNAVAHAIGEEQAGYLMLAVDLFYGPMILVGSAYSLSRMRGLYKGEAEDSPEAQREQISSFLFINLFFALPYAVGGAILAPDIAGLVLTAPAEQGVVPIAAAAVVLSAAMLMMYAATYPLIVFNRRPYLIPAVLGTAALNAALQLYFAHAGAALPDLAWLSAGLLVLAVLLLVAVGHARGFLFLPWLAVLKVILASALMGVVVLLYRHWLPTGEPFSACLLGAGTYFAATAAMKIAHMRELLPARVR